MSEKEVVEKTPEQPIVDETVEKLKVKKPKTKKFEKTPEVVKVDLGELKQKAEEIIKVDLSNPAQNPNITKISRWVQSLRVSNRTRLSSSTDTTRNQK